MISFLTMFLLLLLLSAIAINGFHAITRGQWITHPDGRKEFTGKIFKFWLQFLQRHTVIPVFYSGREWDKEFAKVAVFFQASPSEIIALMDFGLVVKPMDKNKRKYFDAFCAVNDILYTSSIGRTYEGEMLEFYREEKRYKLPFWVREPLGDCITCMASAGGTLMWLFWYEVIVKVQEVMPSAAGMAFLEMPTVSKIGLWVVFCFSLAWFNEIIFYSNHKLKS